MAVEPEAYTYVRITDSDSDVLPVCNKCGAYVRNPKDHTIWHLGNDKARQQIWDAIQGRHP